MATDLDRLLANTKRAWEAATDPAEKARLHAQANQLRAMGASEVRANQLVYGADEGLRRTQQYSAGYGAAPAPTPAPTTRTTRTTSTTTVPMNEHARFIEETWPGGMDAYLAMQAQKLQQAQATGDWGLMERLIKDAERVGYDLTSLAAYAAPAPSFAPPPFDMSQLQRAIRDLERMSTEVPIPAPQLQDPQATVAMIQAVLQQMEPITQARIAELEADHARQMEILRNRLAAQGALGGGGAAALQQEAAESLVRALDAARAEQLAAAIPLGTQLSQAAAEERLRQFEMARMNRLMAMSQAESLIGSMINALQTYDAMRRTSADIALREGELLGTYQGRPTLPLQQWLTGITGMFQGQPTLSRLLTEAELTGIIPEGFPGAGGPTLAARQLQARLGVGVGAGATDPSLSGIISRIYELWNRGDRASLDEAFILGRSLGLWNTRDEMVQRMGGGGGAAAAASGTGIIPQFIQGLVQGLTRPAGRPFFPTNYLPYETPYLGPVYPRVPGGVGAFSGIADILNR